MSTGRNFSRMNIHDLGVEISVFNDSKNDHIALIDNICLGGIRISSETKFEKNSQILLYLNKTKRQYVHGKVKWTQFDKDINCYRYGLEFIVKNGEENKIVADFMSTLLNMLTKEKIVSKTLDLFCSSLSRSPSDQKNQSFLQQIKKILRK